jgi:hypothetical protein
VKRDRKYLRTKDSEKSVRTSFCLSLEAIKELELMTKEKIQTTGKEKTYKNVFDELLNKDLWIEKKEKIESKSASDSEDIRKTFVINQETLTTLIKEAKELKVKRDALLQFLILKQKERRLDKKKRTKIFLKEYSLLCQNIQKISDNLEDNLKYDSDYEICDIYDLLTEFSSLFKKAIDVYLELDIPIDVPVSIPNAIENYKNYLEEQIKSVSKTKEKEK